MILASYSTVRVYAVRVETALMGSDNFLEETIHVTARCSESAQDTAIGIVEKRGHCHRHVISVTRLED